MVKLSFITDYLYEKGVVNIIISYLQKKSTHQQHNISEIGTATISKFYLDKLLINTEALNPVEFCEKYNVTDAHLKELIISQIQPNTQAEYRMYHLSKINMLVDAMYILGTSTISEQTFRLSNITFGYMEAICDLEILYGSYAKLICNGFSHWDVKNRCKKLISRGN